MAQPTITSELWVELPEKQQETVSGGLTMTFPQVSISIDIPSVFGLGNDLPYGLPSFPDDSDKGCIRKEIPMENGRNVEIICDRQTKRSI